MRLQSLLSQKAKLLSRLCGLQLDEVVQFEQLSESWTCKLQHVRLHQVAILLGTQPRLLLHEVIPPSLLLLYYPCHALHPFP